MFARFGFLGEADATTGSNLNPRVWPLDLENGLLIHDPQGRLLEQHQAELGSILAHTRRLEHSSALDATDTYPRSRSSAYSNVSPVPAPPAW